MNDGHIVLTLVTLALVLLDWVVSRNRKKKNLKRIEDLKNRKPVQKVKPEEVRTVVDEQKTSYDLDNLPNRRGTFRNFKDTFVNKGEVDLITKVKKKSTHKVANVIEEGGGPQDRVLLPEEFRQSDVSECNEVLEDFDLRKAVIYSEILKPKYDEF